MRSSAVLEAEVEEKLPALLLTLYQACRRFEVGFSLVYEESCEQWYVTINSCAPGEAWMGPSSCGPDIAIERALEWLDRLENMAQAHMRGSVDSRFFSPLEGNGPEVDVETYQPRTQQRHAEQDFRKGRSV